MTSSGWNAFRDDGYVVIRGLLSRPLHVFLHDYSLKAARAGQLRTGDKQVPGTPYCYGDPLMESLLEALRPRIEGHTGLVLHPTYSYFRVYQRGDVLHRHTDRPSCEASVTISLGSDRVWPIWIEVAGAPLEVRLQPGDGLIYRGIQVPHWRDAFDGEDAAQVFLHYVDRHGEHKDWVFDKRPVLATSPAAQLIIRRLVSTPD